MFYMARSYSRPVVIDVEDILSALKHACNYEADLYVERQLVFSPFGFSREENTKRLLEQGITTYINNNQYCYKYIDETKNVTRYYAAIEELVWTKEPHLQVHLHEYRESKSDIIYDSIESVLQDIKIKYSHFPNEAVSIGLFDDNGYTSLKLQ